MGHGWALPLFLPPHGKLTGFHLAPLCHHRLCISSSPGTTQVLARPAQVWARGHRVGQGLGKVRQNSARLTFFCLLLAQGHQNLPPLTQMLSKRRGDLKIHRKALVLPGA